MAHFLRLTNFYNVAWAAFFTWRTFLARCAFFTGNAWLTFFARCALFTRAAVFTWFTLFAAATTAVAVLLATVTTLIAALRAFAGFLLDDGRLFFFLTSEQADQRLDQTFEQAWLSGSDRLCDYCFNWRWCSALRRGLDRCFLANQGAGCRSLLLFFHFNSRHFIARLSGLRFRAVVTDARNFEVRCFQVVIRNDHDACTRAQLGLGDRVAFFVEQEGGNWNWHLCADFSSAVFQGFFFDQAQNGQRQRFYVADDALTVAAWADDTAAFAQGWAQALARHFQQAKTRDTAHLYAGTVGFQAFTDFFFHGALVLRRGHVDKVDDDQAADVTQTQLAGDFFSRFQVGLQGRFFDVAAFGRARRVDVDGHQGFGWVDHDGTTGRQFHFALEGGFDLAFDLEAVEQRHAVFIQLDLTGVLRHHLIDETQGFLLRFDAVDQYFADVLAQVVADGADDHVAFLIDQEGGSAV